MNIYKISQSVNDGYDTYDSAVVCAENEDDARKIHPSEFTTHWRDGKWYGNYKTSNPETDGKEYETSDGLGNTWVAGNDLDRITVEYLGVAKEGIGKGIIVASFNAG